MFCRIPLQEMRGFMRTFTMIFLSFIVLTLTVSADQNLIRDIYTSIDRIEQEKIFLKPEKLHLKEGKIYVEDIHGIGFPLPVLFSSESGFYTQAQDFNIFNLWQCGKCSYWNHNDDRSCIRCSTPR
jgi:hypothetical protein